ncbi:MAG: cupin domain-containing protein [Pirellulaceae bacterium]
MSVSPQIVPIGAGRTVTVLGGDVVTFKVTAAETDGAFSVFETITPPNGGPPPHVHQREDETFYVLEGEFLFQIGGTTAVARPGTTLVAPRGIPHSFRNVGLTAGKLLVIISPGGFERFIEDFSQLPANAPPDMAKLAAIGQKHGVKFLAACEATRESPRTPRRHFRLPLWHAMFWRKFLPAR